MDPKEYDLRVDWIHLAQDKGILADPFEHSNKPSGSKKRWGNPRLTKEGLRSSRLLVPYSAKLHDFSRKLSTFLLNV
jgi:hypothetical protein